MFTPPPSPLPSTTTFNSSPQTMEKPCSEEIKRAYGRRLRWTAILVPLVFISLTAYLRYSMTRVGHESSQSDPPIFFHGFISERKTWRPHKRRPEPMPAAALSSNLPSSITTGTSTASNPSSQTTSPSQPIPSVPTTPPTIPTPFPQPFDGGMAQNFSTLSCSNFFANMTNSLPFRTCRPFSLLLQTSTQFINAQTNLTLMNSIIWGTCNTTTSNAQCVLNMGWFAMALQTQCSQELTQLNAMATSTLTALQAFEVMHDVACLSDSTSNTYCFIDAVQDPNPSDSYYYQLPLGIPLPSSTTPSCSSCNKKTMSIYANALQNTTLAPQLAALKKSYDPSAAISVQLCGASFAQTFSSAASPMMSLPSASRLFLSLLAWAFLALSL
jgi:hypothetical protein